MGRLLDEDIVIDAVQQHREGVLGGYEYDEGVAFVYAAAHNHIIEVVKQLPSAQPEIIHCRDCKNWDTTWQNDWAKNYHYCPLIDGTRNGDWYCADAERRTDE